LSPLNQALSANLGSRTSAWLYDELTTACVRPPGMGHLEDQRLTTDLTMARDFDLGISGPPMSISMDFIASGLVEAIGGLASALVLAAYTWWAPLVLVGAWFGTHWLLRESAIWRDRNTDEVRQAERHADYAYRLAVDPPAAKELRLFGLARWTVERFASRRRLLLDLRWEATRLRERPVLWSLLLVLSANLLVFGAIASDAAAGRLALAQAVTFVSVAVGISMIAFGGFTWALDGAAAPVCAVLRLREAMATAGALPQGGGASGQDHARKRDPLPRSQLFLFQDQPAGSRGLRSHDSRRLVACNRGPEWGWQDHPRKVIVPTLRSAERRDRDRRCGPA
jgi:ATP-binding cassette subfamily B protein